VEGLVEIYGDTHPGTVEEKKYLLVVERAVAIRKAFYWWVPKRFLR